MAFNTKVDVADTEPEADETVAAEAEDVTLEDEALVEAEPADDADEDDEETDESEDSLTYSNGVIEKIVAMATREVPHVLGMKGNLMHFVQEQFGAENLTKGVTVEVTDDNRVVVNISVIIEYGAYARVTYQKGMFILAGFICENVKRPAARMYVRPAVICMSPM